MVMYADGFSHCKFQETQMNDIKHMHTISHHIQPFQTNTIHEWRQLINCRKKLMSFRNRLCVSLLLSMIVFLSIVVICFIYVTKHFWILVYIYIYIRYIQEPLSTGLLNLHAFKYPENDVHALITLMLV